MARAADDGVALDDAEALRLASRAVRAAVKRVEPSLVRIDGFGVGYRLDRPAQAPNATGVRVRTNIVRRMQGATNDVEHLEQGTNRVRRLRQALPRRRRRPQRRRDPGTGPATGVVLDREGHVLTSTYHFILDQPVLTVTYADGSRHVAEMLGVDNIRNLCVLKVDDAPEAQPPAFLPVGKVRNGQWAVSVGCGYGGGSPAVSLGCISARDRFYGRAVQTDANISPANYGGPLIDIDGNVIGVCVAMDPHREGTALAGTGWYDSGIGFAVPIESDAAWLRALKSGRDVEPALLGVSVAPAGTENPGVRIMRVRDGSAAAVAGLGTNDTIRALGGKPVDSPAALRALVHNFEMGSTTDVEVLRGKQKRPETVKVTFKTPGAD
jgi:serine protease Do